MPPTRHFAALMLVIVSVVYSAHARTARAAPPWPGDAGVEIGLIGQAGGLPSGYEPSGAAWHAGLGMLVIVGDDGDVSIMEADGSNKTTWTPGGDLEAVAIADPGDTLVYLGREHPDAVLEFDLATGLLTGNSWDLTPYMTGAINSGLEALTYVDGLFYAGHQGEGNIYVFDLQPAGVVQHLATLPPPGGRTDVSGLDFDPATGTLYAIYDSFNVIVEMTADGTFLSEYTLAGDNQEGVAIVKSCPAVEAEVFIAEDPGEVWRYGGYPVACGGDSVPALSLAGIALFAALAKIRGSGPFNKGV